MNDTPTPTPGHGCPAPSCEYRGRDSSNVSLHFMRRHTEWVAGLLRSGQDTALTALAVESVFVNDLAVALFILARVAGSAPPTYTAQALATYEMAGNLLRARSIPAGPVFHTCRVQLAALLSSYEPEPFVARPPRAVAGPSPTTPFTTPPHMIMRQRPHTPAAPARDRPPVPLPGGLWHISPRRLFPPISANLWDEARFAPTVQVFKLDDYIGTVQPAGAEEPTHECAICIEPAWVKMAIPGSPSPWTHLSCTNRQHWLHDTCLAGYIEHQLAVRGIRELEVRQAALGNNESRLLAMEAHLARHAGPFACAHCRKRYESYHAMAVFVSWVKNHYNHYESPNYNAVHLQHTMENEAEHMRAIDDIIRGDGGDDDGAILIHDDNDDDASFIADSDAEPQGVASAYNLRVRRERNPLGQANN